MKKTANEKCNEAFEDWRKLAFADSATAPGDSSMTIRYARAIFDWAFVQGYSCGLDEAIDRLQPLPENETPKGSGDQ